MKRMRPIGAVDTRQLWPVHGLVQPIGGGLLIRRPAGSCRSRNPSPNPNPGVPGSDQLHVLMVGEKGGQKGCNDDGHYEPWRGEHIEPDIRGRDSWHSTGLQKGLDGSTPGGKDIAIVNLTPYVEER
jgi:hypothetical protein